MCTCVHVWLCVSIHPASLWSRWQSVASSAWVILLGTFRSCQSAIQLLFSLFTTRACLSLSLSLFLHSFSTPPFLSLAIAFIPVLRNYSSITQFHFFYSILLYLFANFSLWALNRDLFFSCDSITAVNLPNMGKKVIHHLFFFPFPSCSSAYRTNVLVLRELDS